MIPEGRGCESAFCKGLLACGYTVLQRKKVKRISRDDVLVIWNRKRYDENLAESFEKAGARVIVTENGYLGKSWLGKTWFAAALGQHAGAGEWPVGGPERWDNLSVELQPWRKSGSEIVILAQRGIGSSSTRQPNDWSKNMHLRLAGYHSKVRVRAHPGGTGRSNSAQQLSLEDDLLNAQCAVTWASAAAFKALVMGVPVFYGFKKWIGASTCDLITIPLPEPSYGDRLGMFRRLIWAMWQPSEIVDGTAIRWLLKL